MSYCIVKIMENKDGGRPIHHIIIDSMAEVMEFTEEETAKTYKDLLEANSDSGHKYVVKKIGEAK